MTANDLSSFTTLGVGGPAAKIIHVTTEAQLIEAVKAADDAKTPILILGGGSNVLISDTGFAGTVIRVETTGNTYEIDACSGGSAAFVPPFSDKPIKGVVEFAGQGLAMTNYSKNQAAASKFLEFMTTDAAAKILDGVGLIPNITGSKTTNPVNQQMLDFAAKQSYVRYPMLDNVLQGDVVDAGNKIIPAILGGKTKVADGLKQMAQVWKALPAAKRGASYN